MQKDWIVVISNGNNDRLAGKKCTWTSRFPAWLSVLWHLVALEGWILLKWHIPEKMRNTISQVFFTWPNLSDMFVPGINSIMRTIELTTYIITPLVAGQVWSLTKFWWHSTINNWCSNIVSTNTLSRLCNFANDSSVKGPRPIAGRNKGISILPDEGSLIYTKNKLENWGSDQTNGRSALLTRRLCCYWVLYRRLEHC